MWRPWENDFDGIRNADNNDRNIAAEAALDQPPESVLDQPPINSKRKILSYETKKYILIIYNKLKSDGEPYPLERTAQVTETPKSTVRMIIKPTETETRKFKSLTPTHADLIRKKVDELYKKGTVPAISVLYNQLRAEGVISCCQKTLHKFVKSIGVLDQEVGKEQCLMESEVILKWRFDFNVNLVLDE
jgi:hypothetical protein